PPAYIRRANAGRGASALKNPLSRQNTFEHHAVNDIEARAFGAGRLPLAGVVELVDTLGLGPSAKSLGVRVPPPAPGTLPAGFFRQAGRQDAAGQRFEQKVE